MKKKLEIIALSKITGYGSGFNDEFEKKENLPGEYLSQKGWPCVQHFAECSLVNLCVLS